MRGWDFPATLALLGVYLVVGRCAGCSLAPAWSRWPAWRARSGPGASISPCCARSRPSSWPASGTGGPSRCSTWLLGLLVVGAALAQPGQAPSAAQLLAFFLALSAGVAILYAILLASTALVFLSPGFLFTWVFDGLFQMARYPLGLYPGWARLVLTWVIPVGLITTVPAQALTGRLALPALLGIVALAGGLVVGASLLFRGGLRRYHSASS
jgi:ABC-2 type transport system permease protein